MLVFCRPVFLLNDFHYSQSRDRWPVGFILSSGSVICSATLFTPLQSDIRFLVSLLPPPPSWYLPLARFTNPLIAYEKTSLIRATYNCYGLAFLLVNLFLLYVVRESNYGAFHVPLYDTICIRP